MNASAPATATSTMIADALELRRELGRLITAYHSAPNTRAEFFFSNEVARMLDRVDQFLVSYYAIDREASYDAQLKPWTDQPSKWDSVPVPSQSERNYW
jgi:hypothetical protein